MGNVKCSIVAPFWEFNLDVEGFIVALNCNHDLDKFEIIFVAGNYQANYLKIIEQIKAVIKQDFVLLQDNTKNSGPSRSWCLGLKAAHGEYVAFLATDTTLNIDWCTTAISRLNSISNEEFLIGNTSGSLTQSNLDKIEMHIDRRRSNSLIADFRNFIGKRESLLHIIDKYCLGKYFSDVELDFIIRKYLHLRLTPFPELTIYNKYPSNFIEAIKRKFKHGVGYGRICKVFIDRFRKFRTAGLREFIFAASIYFKEATYANLSARNRIILTLFNTTFLSGMFLGICLPGGFVRKYYFFHFDES